MNVLVRIVAALLAVGLVMLPGGLAAAADDAAGVTEPVRGPRPSWPDDATDDTGALAASVIDGPYSVTPEGVVIAHNGAPHHGDARNLDLWQPVVGIAVTPSSGGYWLAARDSGVFSFGDARYRGNLIDQLIVRDNLPPGSLNGGNILEYLDGEIVDIAAAPTGQGYWLLGADGGVFNFGSAQFAGSPAGRFDPNWQHVARAILPRPGGYSVTVFLYPQGALTEADGLIGGILQTWDCAGACVLQGQYEAREAVAGVPAVPPPPPAAPPPDFAGQYLNIVGPTWCATQHLQRAWVQVDPEDDGFFYWEWPIVEVRLLPWMVKVAEEMYGDAALMGDVPWPAALVQDIESFRIALVKQAFVLESYGRARDFDDWYWLDLEFQSFDSQVGTFDARIRGALGIPPGLDYCG